MPTKHFLDTSVFRPAILSSDVYKKYLKTSIDYKAAYASPFIQMEFTRSYILNVIDFYFVLNLPSVKTVEDALSVWQHKFGKAALKAIVVLIPKVFSTHHKVDMQQASDKAKAQKILAMYIKRLAIKAQGLFKDPSNDNTKCPLGTLSLDVEMGTANQDLGNYCDAFRNPSNRKACKVDKIILEKYQNEIRSLLQRSTTTPRNNDTKGFHDIVENINIILTKGGGACTCSMCAKIGDLIISLNTPKDMQLEHTDKSFDYLCPPINQPHRKLLSEIEIIHQSS